MTLSPFFAICQAASHPANPAPMTTIGFIALYFRLSRLRISNHAERMERRLFPSCLIPRRDIHIPSLGIASRSQSFLPSQPRMGNHTEDTSLEWVCPIRRRYSEDSWYSCKTFFLYGSSVQRSSHRIPLEDTQHPYL